MDPTQLFTREQSSRAISRVLVVDDEPLIANTIVTILERYGFQATAAYNGTEAVELASAFCPDCMITDVMMPGMTGIEAARQVQEACPAARILLFSGQAATADLLAEARSQGLDFELLPKPIHPRVLIDKLREP
ncbi:MAG: response regulator [Candidatus Korobacteraceae bacterium]